MITMTELSERERGNRVRLATSEKFRIGLTCIAARWSGGGITTSSNFDSCFRSTLVGSIIYRARGRKGRRGEEGVRAETKQAVAGLSNLRKQHSQPRKSCTASSKDLQANHQCMLLFFSLRPTDRRQKGNFPLATCKRRETPRVENSCVMARSPVKSKHTQFPAAQKRVDGRPPVAMPFFALQWPLDMSRRREMRLATG